MTGGWFVGNFEPTALKLEHAEVAFKAYKAGDREPCHHHKFATEVTLIVRGICKFHETGDTYADGDILVISPDESVEFHALTDCETVVFKMPSLTGDKYDG